jgi:glycosyltransferase involved in cell wall biosynthesis
MEKDSPLVSVCMPAYNAGKYVAQAVASVLGQSYQNIELIIVNDGSTDDTAAIINALTDTRVSVLHQTNKGQCAAANAAFNASKGQLIKFMDADDIISPRFIEAQVKRLGTRDNAVVSAAWGRFYNDDLDTFNLSRESVWRDLPADEWLAQSWINGNSVMQCALWLIPRNLLTKSGLWDESLSLINDVDFFTRVLLQCNGVLFEEEAVLYYRSGNKNSLSGQFTSAAIQSAFKAIDKATANLTAASSTKNTLLACANVWQNFIYTVYPAYPELTSIAQQRVETYGGASLQFPSGGVTRLIVKILGWKYTLRLKHYLNLNK